MYILKLSWDMLVTQASKKSRADWSKLENLWHQFATLLYVNIIMKELCSNKFDQTQKRNIANYTKQPILKDNVV